MDRLRAGTIKAIERINQADLSVEQARPTDAGAPAQPFPPAVPQGAGSQHLPPDAAPSKRAATPRQWLRRAAVPTLAIAVGAAAILAPPVAAAVVVHGAIHGIAAATVGGEVVTGGVGALNWGRRKLRKG